MGSYAVNLLNWLMRKRKVKFPVELIILIMLIVIVSALTITSLLRFFQTLDYFRVKEIVSNEQNLLDLSHLKGENIFTIDLAKESRSLTDGLPNYRKIRMVRILPNRLFVELVRRKPVAVLKPSLHNYLDEEGVFFYSADFTGLELPAVEGLDKNNLKDVASILAIINEAHKKLILKYYKLQDIDVSNPNSIEVSLLPKQADGPTNTLAVKLSRDNIKDKMNILAGILMQTMRKLRNIKYIDLRFYEPVIKLNEDKD